MNLKGNRFNNMQLDFCLWKLQLLLKSKELKRLVRVWAKYQVIRILMFLRTRKTMFIFLLFSLFIISKTKQVSYSFQLYTLLIFWWISLHLIRPAYCIFLENHTTLIKMIFIICFLLHDIKILLGCIWPNC